MKKFLPAIYLIAAFGAIFVIGLSIPQEDIKLLIQRSGTAAPLIYVVAMLITLVIAPLSGTPVIYAGFFAFGKNVVFLNIIASYISFVINFWIGRKYGRPIVSKIVGNSNMSRVDKLIESYGVPTLFFLRMFQGALHDFISLASGLTDIKFSKYLIVSVIATIPGTYVWYLLAGKSDTPTAFAVISVAFAWVMSGLFIVGSIMLRKIKARKSS